RLGCDELDLCPASFLCQPDMTQRREVERGDHDVIAGGLKLKSRCHCRCGVRDTAQNGDILYASVDQLGKLCTRGVDALHPVTPVGATGFPAVEVVERGISYRAAERTLRATGQLGCTLQNGEQTAIRSKRMVHLSLA